jgi:hypothetical protein
MDSPMSFMDLLIYFSPDSSYTPMPVRSVAARNGNLVPKMQDHVMIRRL